MTPKKPDTNSLSSGPDEKGPLPDQEVATTSDVELAAFGTSVQYSQDEERQLVKKLDWRIMPLVTILYLANFIDRTNVGNAKVAGLSKDLGLVGNQYNIGLSIFYIMYALSEVPSNLILKKLGANRWIPCIVFLFGFVCFITAFIKNFSGFMAIRVFLGLAEGGMMPGVAYYLSTYYKRHELVLRVGIFVSASSMSGAFGGLLASGLLKIPQIKGLPHGQWRNIFFVEGLITMALAVVAFMFLPGHPETTPFLDDRERTIATERLRVETAGLSHAEKTDFKLIWRAFRSVNNWFCGIGFFLCNIPTQAISLFMPSLLKGMGYSTIQSQLRSVPPYVVACSWSIFVAWASYRTGRRGIPRYIKGNSILIGACGMLWLTTSMLILYNIWENKARAAGKRDYRLDADEETISKLGHLHPRFRLTL
ncbi:hypothetical protein FRC03_002755 [Tulasnella sp. 419]|nr:hypothetical protein FRC03_002755 [Tulasnella sp. 419]